MSNQPRSRQELYERIRQTSKEQFIFEEMVRLGFWTGGHPHNNTVTKADRERLAELNKEIQALRTEQSRLHNNAALLKAARLQRMAESRKRQQETKERRERERVERAAAWRQRQARQITYLGQGVSGGLGGHDIERDRLEVLGLPVLATAEEIAGAMGITISALRFLTFNRPVSTVNHYARFQVPKKTGGVRLISAPMPRLKTAQRWLLENILDRVPAHDAAHGFRPGRSIVSNAKPHVGRDVVVNLDLKDFFPTLTFSRVLGLFKALGYSQAVSTVFALLTTEPDIETVELDGKTWHVAMGPRLLPQGAPSSPAITNLICRKLDTRLKGLAESLGFTYTRYADDLTFSGSGQSTELVGRLLGQVRRIIADEGFHVHPDKTRVLRKGRRQEVTGLVVNERPNVPRKTLRRFRATLFQIEKDGPEGKTWGDPATDVLASIEGFANFVFMVDPNKGRPLKERVRAIHQRYGRPIQIRPAPGTQRPAAPAAAANIPVPTPSAPSADPLAGPPPIPVTQTTPAPEPAQTPAEIPIDVPGNQDDGAEDEEGQDKKWWKLW